MEESRIKRLRQGKTVLTIVTYLINKHPKGMKRSEIQEQMIHDLGVGESTGGVNRQLKKLKETNLITWNQNAYTYNLPKDHDTKEYYMRIIDTLDMTTDQAYFLQQTLKKTTSKKTRADIDDYLGQRYDNETNENTKALEEEYKKNDTNVQEAITKLQKHHNAYVRMRLFKTTNECFLRDLSQLEAKEAEILRTAYAKNLKSAVYGVERETKNIFRCRGELIKQLNEKRLSKRMKFLIRFTLNNLRPAHIYDGMI